MTETLLTRVKSSMFVHLHRRTRGLLDGEYASVFKGRSLDFEDLRTYVAGDEVRDIDWKATARQGSTLVKRYVAVRKQLVLLVADTGRNMAAVTRSGESKRDVAIMAFGVMGYLASRHADLVGLARADADGGSSLPLLAGEPHLERLLQEVYRGTRLDGPASDTDGLLRYVADSSGRRMLLFVVADEAPIGPETRDLLRRLRVQHEILWLTVEDADLTSPVTDPGPGGDDAMVDVASDAWLPESLRRDRRLTDQYRRAAEQLRENTTAALRSLGIAHQRVGATADVVPAMFALLESHRRAR
ncbi:hypothetical protein GCM10011512_08940 [Tersicoccus solisilvae]|uniref:DUF58 domain-containing protein n=1 Tax=Tersicoccus solisilvae TaxID=1882339 RepID=A0ABQ1NSH9_9MICC|nr:DUF58 domain-containing protein [Tersicoccus solisilvae]GGC84334.1 hypothetical protein GCM10011512_08940 [Tersicoccus solisilvae]